MWSDIAVLAIGLAGLIVGAMVGVVGYYAYLTKNCNGVDDEDFFIQ